MRRPVKAQFASDSNGLQFGNSYRKPKKIAGSKIGFPRQAGGLGRMESAASDEQKGPGGTLFFEMVCVIASGLGAPAETNMTTAKYSWGTFGLSENGGTTTVLFLC